MPRVTVLLPVHRPPALLPYAIESVLAQSQTDFELMVVCDGAPKETVACARSYGERDARVRTFDFTKGERNGEAHRHTVLLEASGEIVAQIADDDIWFPDHLTETETLLAAADFGHVIHTAAHRDGSVTALACDLSNPAVRRRLINDKYNGFGPTFCAYRLDAYRRLPEGWAPAPANVWSDLYMWRKFLRRADMTFKSRAVVTAVHLPAVERRDMSLVERAAENELWFRRISDPNERKAIAEEAMRSLIAQSARRQTGFAGWKSWRCTVPLRAFMERALRRTSKAR